MCAICISPGREVTHASTVWTGRVAPQCHVAPSLSPDGITRVVGERVLCLGVRFFSAGDRHLEGVLIFPLNLYSKFIGLN
uniref:Uncharacterized protein n=1 Tax=Steinernema glaseri TaxID=37863 RepID=A0A1I8ACE2_9BILA